MKKIMVIGCPGSGKSTFSRSMHKLTDIPLFHLDMMYWNEDKTTVDTSVFHERLSNTIQKDEWIIDGNYGATIELGVEKGVIYKCVEQRRVVLSYSDIHGNKYIQYINMHECDGDMITIVEQPELIVRTKRIRYVQ